MGDGGGEPKLPARVEKWTFVSMETVKLDEVLVGRNHLPQQKKRVSQTRSQEAFFPFLR